MKAITIHQPWASLIAIGEKRIETRSWPTKHRGPIAIHAGLKIEKEYILGCEYFRQTAAPHGLLGPLSFVSGAVVAIAEIIDCIPTADCLASGLLTRKEMEFGDFTAGRWAWLLGPDIIKIRPVPVRGKQGLWEWDYETREPK